jgi:Uma2 family endonuclease
MSVTEQTFPKLLLEDPGRRWELHGGQLREKPPMSYRHNFAVVYLGGQLLRQLDPAAFQVRINLGHVRRTEQNYFIPDVFVLPVAHIGPDRDRPDMVEIYDRPLPLVVEVWSPSTGEYDVDTKFAEYRKRGDAEIWRLHPFERTLTVWRRRDDGGYDEAVYHGGTVEPIAVPGVTIDLDALFA